MSHLTDDPQANYRLFIDEIKASGLVWGISTSEGWVVCDSEEYEETDVIPFWSSEADARAHCSGEWAEFEPQSITLDVFADRWLTGMVKDDVLAGPNWNEELAGLEVEPADLAKELLD
ncbi:DUF2750 domain-containing protein [Motiliproteus sediminis]|uniref:DUF2750 domain-containing protein n=1 Tax=Motiliproteus sediminis TaxID=1468178 RepID=UPI001AEFCB55|nr:DUF2750 domain-containing protein [Motiliproteus sediminis]